ncbi:MAG: SRPBCC family protein [Halobacteriaceae archaeon]
MTTTTERSFVIDAPIEDIWEIISDPAIRADSISVVEDYEILNGQAVWHLSLPIPVVNQTVKVKTRDVKTDPPRYVKFIGSSSVMEVTGEHELTETPDGCQIRVSFRVNGKLPGVERFFSKNIDKEINNLHNRLEKELFESE